MLTSLAQVAIHDGQSKRRLEWAKGVDNSLHDSYVGTMLFKTILSIILPPVPEVGKPVITIDWRLWDISTCYTASQEAGVNNDRMLSEIAFYLWDRFALPEISANQLQSLPMFLTLWKTSDGNKMFARLTMGLRKVNPLHSHVS